MLVLINGILLFFIAFFTHLFIWKLRLPKNHTQVLLAIFSGVFLVGVLLLKKLGRFDLFDYLQLIFLYVSLALAYITTYSGIEVESPSLRIVLEIDKAGPKGLEAQALSRIFTDDYLVGLRVKDLVKDAMIRFDNNRYKLSPKGRVLAGLFVFTRNFLKAGKGG